MRESYRNARQVSVEQITNIELVARIYNRPQQANCHSFDVFRFQALDGLESFWDVQGRVYNAVIEDAFGDFKCQGAGNVGFWIGYCKVEGLDLAAFANNQYVFMALSREEGSLSGGARNYRIGGVGRPVDENVGLGEKRGQFQAVIERCQLEGRKHAFDGAFRGRGGLIHSNLAAITFDDQIGERPPSIHGEAHQPTPDASAIWLEGLAGAGQSPVSRANRKVFSGALSAIATGAIRLIQPKTAVASLWAQTSRLDPDY